MGGQLLLSLVLNRLHKTSTLFKEMLSEILVRYGSMRPEEGGGGGYFVIYMMGRFKVLFWVENLPPQIFLVNSE